MATIVTKNSSTASAVPTTSDLVQGELAVNVTDKRIFTENASTQIVELGTNPSSITTATATVTGTLTANGTFASSNAVITGGSINSTPIGATTPSTIVGSTVTANTGFVGGLTGNVTGNLTGNVTGNVAGNLTGNVTGNVTASSGTTTLNDLVVNGTADFTNTKLTNITTPTVGTDAANKSYVDDTVAAVIDSAPAALDTLNELAAALGDDANFAGTVTTALATKLPLAGGTMTGAIAMGTSKITGLGNPTSAQDAATKTYVDTADALKLNLTGGTMSGAIAMGTNKITGVGNPTLAQDAATKDYVDDILGSATSAATSAAAAATSASNAATSASNAASSATASSNSASAAAASYDAFDDRYLGDKASDPTLDNDGNALLTGALYFNTTSDVMKVYDGSAWNIAAISSSSPTFTGTVTADGLSLGDNDKATFGAGNDLEIYHDGGNSFITNSTGNLTLDVAGDIILDADGGDVSFRDAGVEYGRITNNATNLQIYSAVQDVDIQFKGNDGGSTITALTLDMSAAGVATFNSNVILPDNSYFLFGDTTSGIQGNSSSDFIKFYTANTPRLLIDINGDISFYEDTGTTPKFFWDASAESLGIGTSLPANGKLVIEESGTSVGSTIRLIGTNTTGSASQVSHITSYQPAGGAAEASALDFKVRGTDPYATPSTVMTLLGGGNVGINITSPVNKLHLLNAGTTAISNGIANSGMIVDGGSGNAALNLITGDAGICYVNFGDSTDSNIGRIFYQHTDNSMVFSTNVAERMRIDSSGRVGIGNTAPQYQLDLNATGSNTLFGAGISASTASGPLNLSLSSWGQSGGRSGIITFTTGSTTNGTERMRIDDSGNLLVGKTTAPTVGIGQYIKPNGETFHTINNSYNTLHVYNVDASAYRFYVGSDGTVHATNTSISAISDASLKENIRDLDKGLDTVLALKPRRFDWKNGDGNDIMGFIAQEVEEVMPELIDEAQYNKDETKKSLKMGDMIPSLVKAIQEQQAIIESLTNRIAALEGN